MLRFRDIPRVPIVIVVLALLIVAYPMYLFIYFDYVPEYQVQRLEPINPWTWNKTILPDTYKVFHYDIDIAFDKKLENYTGTVEIQFSMDERSQGIVLHSQRLQILHAHVRYNRSMNSSIFHPDYITNDKEHHFIFLSFASCLPSGNATLHFLYYGTLRDTNGRGIVYNQFTSCTGDKEQMIHTQFNPIFARRAFPCFDEPRFKSTFQLRLTYFKNYSMVVSNTGRESLVQNEDGSRSLTFKVTPKMSTHLLSFAMANYEAHRTDKGSNASYQLTMWTESCKMQHIKWSYDLSYAGLEWMQNYTQYPIPASKLDMIDVPRLSKDAFGSWGLIFFKSSALLVDDPRNPSFYSITSISSSVLSQIVYQWVGALVTHGQWRESWIYMSLSEFLPYLCLHEFFPGWDVPTIFYAEKTFTALYYDKYTCSLPLLPDEKSNSTNHQFLKYIPAKAAVLTRTVYRLIGPERFQIAIRRFINKYQYGTVTTQDILNEYSAVYRANLTEYLMPWLTRRGYPVLTYRMRQSELFVQQRPFALTIDPKNSSLLGDVWWVPVSYRTSRGVIAPIFTKDRVFQVSDISLQTWYKSNVNALGFYIVNYPLDNWYRLGTELRKDPNIVEHIDRVDVLVNAFMLAEAGSLDYDTAFKILFRILPKEQNLNVWRAVFKVLNTLNSYVSNLGCYGHFKRLMKELLDPQLKKYAWNATYTDLIKNAKRAYMFYYATLFSEIDPEFTDPAFELWYKFLEDPISNPIDVNIQGPLLVVIGSVGTYTDWYNMLDLFFNSTNPFDVERYISGLAATRDVFLMKHLLDVSMDATLVDPSSQLKIFQQVGKNPSNVGLYVLWEFVLKKWDQISDNTAIVSTLLQMFSKFQTQIKLDQLRELYEPFMSAYQSPFQLTLDEIRSNILWYQKHQDTICNLLIDYFENSKESK